MFTHNFCISPQVAALSHCLAMNIYLKQNTKPTHPLSLVHKMMYAGQWLARSHHPLNITYDYCRFQAGERRGNIPRV